MFYIANFLYVLLTIIVVTTSPALAEQKWIGIMAVQESALVNLTISENGNDPALYGPALRSLLDSGQIAPAKGNYCFIPYSGGKPSEQPECFYTRTGVYTMWAPGTMVKAGKAMCVSVPSSWPAIAGQRRYPNRGGKAVNCYDFGASAENSSFASTRHTAAMIVVVKPRN